MVVELPSDMTLDAFKSMDQDQADMLPWRPLSEADYYNSLESDVRSIVSVEEWSNPSQQVDGVIHVNCDGEWTVTRPWERREWDV